jgi:thymidylate kinase
MAYPFLISFSGLDGSGKTQLIILLRQYFRRQGISYLCVHTVQDSFDNRLAKRFAFLNKMTDGSDQSATESQPRKPIPLFVFFLKLISIFLYAFQLRWRLFRRGLKYKAIIFDRYVYDKLVQNAFLRNKGDLSRASFLIKLYPRPNLPLYLQVAPEVAWERKKESLDPSQNRKYFENKYRLYEQAKDNWKLVAIDNNVLSVSEAKKKILSLFKKRFYRYNMNRNG